MPLPALSDDALDALDVLLLRIETVDDLHQRGLLSAAEAATGVDGYLDDAAAVAGTSLNRADLEAARAILEAGFLDGWLDLIDLVWVVVAALLLVSLVWLIRLYVVPLVLHMPRWVHELLAWGACLAVVIAPAHLLDGGGRIAVAIVGCLGMVGALLLTLDIHFRRWGSGSALRSCSLILCAAWAAVAIGYGSAFIGGMAVFAWLGAAGSRLLGEDQAVHAAMLASLTLLLPALGVALTRTPLPETLAVFQPGALALCGTVYLSGCLVLSSRHYPQRGRAFVLHQLLALGSAAAAVVLGTVAGLDHLQEAGGTFFAAYLLEKFFEIPWKRAGYAWMCLALAGVLCAGAAFAERHPELFFGL